MFSWQARRYRLPCWKAYREAAKNQPQIELNMRAKWIGKDWKNVCPVQLHSKVPLQVEHLTVQQCRIDIYDLGLRIVNDIVQPLWQYGEIPFPRQFSSRKYIMEFGPVPKCRMCSKPAESFNHFIFIFCALSSRQSLKGLCVCVFVGPKARIDM